jgi:hypothetical protein
MEKFINAYASSQSHTAKRCAVSLLSQRGTTEQYSVQVMDKKIWDEQYMCTVNEDEQVEKA